MIHTHTLGMSMEFSHLVLFSPGTNDLYDLGKKSVALLHSCICLHWRSRVNLWAQAKVWLEWERAPSQWRSKHEGFADICLHWSTDRDSTPISHGSRLPAKVANSPHRNRLVYFQFLPVTQKEPDSGFHTQHNHWKRREPEQWQPSSDGKLIIYSLLHAMPFSIQSTTILTFERDLYRFNLRTHRAFSWLQCESGYSHSLTDCDHRNLSAIIHKSKTRNIQSCETSHCSQTQKNLLCVCYYLQESVAL
jgi:hypothetical protein